MLCDARGRNLSAGDLVLVPFRVKAIVGDSCVLENISMDTSAILRVNSGDEIDYQVEMARGRPPNDKGDWSNSGISGSLRG